MKTDIKGTSKLPLHSFSKYVRTFIVARNINLFTILFGVLIKEFLKVT